MQKSTSILGDGRMKEGNGVTRARSHGLYDRSYSRGEDCPAAMGILKEELSTRFWDNGGKSSTVKEAA